MTFPALLVSGDTYQHRRQLRAFGGTWEHSQTGYVFPANTPHRAAIEALGLSVDEIEWHRDPAAPETREEIRARRNARRERIAGRLESQAQTQDRNAAQARAKHRPYTSDWSFLTQPILVGHHSEKGHRRLWDRIDSARNAEMEARGKAADLRSTAERLRTVGAAVKGDAEERRQAAKAEQDKVIRVGSIVRCGFSNREAVVQKVNRQTYTLRFESGATYTEQKHFVTFLRHGNPETAAKPVRPFVKGQRVRFARLMWKGEGVVQRVNPNTCTVRIEQPGKWCHGNVEGFRYDELSAMPEAQAAE